ncbi:hypothetical protein [Tenacibaculum sp.]|uniref:hypothetical protein n=1 Tax=Tenacibaculum sp. TaxID=1906242 RepID=UPI003AA88E01
MDTIQVGEIVSLELSPEGYVITQIFFDKKVKNKKIEYCYEKGFYNNKIKIQELSSSLKQQDTIELLACREIFHDSILKLKLKDEIRKEMDTIIKKWNSVSKK